MNDAQYMIQRLSSVMTGRGDVSLRRRRSSDRSQKTSVQRRPVISQCEQDSGHP